MAEIKRETRGRKPTYNDPSQLSAAVESYFEECARRNDAFPDYAGMCHYLKVSKAYLERLAQAPHENWERYAEILTDAQLRRESYLNRAMVTDNKRAQGCYNALKQKENGGYTDKPQDNTERTLKLNISGIGGSMDLFKG